jgi:hypothetical protein
MKVFEIRDAGTHISAGAFAIDTNDLPPGRPKQVLQRAGLADSGRAIVFGALTGGEWRASSYDWSSTRARTMPAAHKHIEDNWDELESGALIDVEYLLGISDEPKETELE